MLQLLTNFPQNASSHRDTGLLQSESVMRRPAVAGRPTVKRLCLPAVPSIASTRHVEFSLAVYRPHRLVIVAMQCCLR